MPNGYGKLKLGDGRVYEGNFIMGKCNRKGIIKYSGEDVYDGELS